MNLTRITYIGRKVYRDKLSGNTWATGDTKLVTAEQATKLLRFPEFTPAKQEAERTKTKPDTKQEAIDPEVEAAKLREQESERTKDQERQQLEAMLLTVESMDKSALVEYAQKYEVNLDKRVAVAKLRAEVAVLVEQFGPR